MIFPQFRKYKNNKSYFKINSINSFEEIKQEVSGYILYKFTAAILPDRNFISDMLSSNSVHWQLITQQEYDEVKSKVNINDH
ncbi:MAG: hypothetical protein IT235_08235 [Bacteroidia bacterium]|nr:hypothetical protein [Bacteroidia bacterium]